MHVEEPPVAELAERYDTAPVAVLVVGHDDQSRIIYANASAAALFGRPVDDLVGRSVDELTPMTSRDDHAELRRRFLAQNGAARARPSRIVHSLLHGEDHLVVIDLAEVDTSQGPHIVATVRPLETWIDAATWAHSAFEHTPVAMALVHIEPDGNHRIRSANGALADLLGQPVSELSGKTLDDLRAPDDVVAAMPASADQRHAAPMSTMRRARLSHRDGHDIWCEIHTREVPAADNDAVALAHIVDISAQIELELVHREAERRLEQQIDERTQALAASELQLRQSLTAASMATWHFDVATGRVEILADHVDWMERQQRKTQRDALAMVHPDDQAAFHQAILDAADARSSFDFTVRSRPDLPQPWVRIAGEVILGPDGSVEQLMGIVQDVTAERELVEAARRNERLLSEREEHLKLVLAATTTGTWDWRIDRGVITFSEEWLTHLGYAEGSLATTPWQWERLVHSDDWNETSTRLAEHFERRRAFCECTHRLRTSDGQWRWFRTRGRVVERDESGSPLRMIGADVDISDQRRLEDQLTHGAKMQALGTFAGSVAHDFNNVLAIIRGHVELLRRPDGAPIDDPAESARRLAAIEESIDRASSFVRQLMTLGRPKESRPADVELSCFLGDLEPTLAQFVGEDVIVDVALPSSPVPVRIDAGLLEALVLNLAANSRDAMPDGGTLEISLRLDHGNDTTPLAVLEIADNGVGMSPSVAAEAFEPFFTTKAPGVGTGLGLANAMARSPQRGERSPSSRLPEPAPR